MKTTLGRSRSRIGQPELLRIWSQIRREFRRTTPIDRLGHGNPSSSQPEGRRESLQRLWVPWPADLLHTPQRQEMQLGHVDTLRRINRPKYRRRVARRQPAEPRNVIAVLVLQ